MVIALPMSFSKKYGRITPPDQRPYHTVIFRGSIDVCKISRGFSSPHIRQFCLLTKPPSSKCATSLKMTKLKKLTCLCKYHSTKWGRDSWSFGFSSWKGLSCKSFRKMLYNVCRFRSSCYERYRMDVLGFFSIFALTAAVFSMESLFRSYTLRFWSFANSVFSNLSIIIFSSCFWKTFPKFVMCFDKKYSFLNRIFIHFWLLEHIY